MIPKRLTRTCERWWPTAGSVGTLTSFPVLLVTLLCWTAGYDFCYEVLVDPLHWIEKTPLYFCCTENVVLKACQVAD